jgi:hypothetical protein
MYLSTKAVQIMGSPRVLGRGDVSGRVELKVENIKCRNNCMKTKLRILLLVQEKNTFSSFLRCEETSLIDSDDVEQQRVAPISPAA